MENPIQTTHVIKGRITDTSGQPISGLIVRAFDKDPNTPENPLGKEAITDNDGNYIIQYTESDFRYDGIQTSGNNIVIHAYSGDILVAKSSPLTNKSELQTVDLTVPARNYQEGIQIIVSGLVLNTYNEPVAHVPVFVMDVDLRGAEIYDTAESLTALKESEGFEFLQEGISDAQGYYQIKLNSTQGRRGEKGLLDIIAYAVDNDSILGRSSLVIHASNVPNPQLESLDILLKTSQRRGTSEYEKIMTSIFPLLKTGEIALYQLTNKQTAFLATETNQNVRFIRLLALAEKIEIAYKRQELQHELLYGIGRQNIPLNLLAIATRKTEEIFSAVKEAIRKNIISEQTDEVVQQFVNNLHAVALENGFDQSSNAEEIAVGRILSSSLSEANIKTAFFKAYSNFEGPAEKFWGEHLPSQPEFKDRPDLIAKLKLTNQLNVLSNGHLPMIEELQVKRGLDINALMKMPRQEWLEIIKQTGVPPQINGSNEEERMNAYADNIQNILNAAYPTQKISTMIRNQELNHHDENIHQSLNSFFEKAKDFDFATSRVNDFQSIIKEVAPEREGDVRNYLQSIQRVYQISPTPDAVGKLLDKGLDSSYKIASYPEQVFLDSFADHLGGLDKAKMVYERATYQAMRSQNTTLMINEIISNGTIAASTYSESHDELINTIQKHIPNWEELFGRADICETKHCESVYGPAAYLVDIMRFLAMSKKNDVNNSPLDKLLERRPDLSFTPLTCENTETIIPYIDLVNEVLEYYVVKGKLDADAAHDTGKTTAQELRAQPQYTMNEAYKKLKDSVYPFTLPYHQPLDAIRIYLSFIQTSRNEVIETFGDPLNIASLSESLSLSEEEYKILVGKDFTDAAVVKNLWEYFGYANQNDLKNIVKVPEFLTRTGVKYVDLVELVKTQFINPYQYVFDYVESIFKGTDIDSTALYSKLKNIKEGVLLPENDPAIKKALDDKGIPYNIFKDKVINDFEKLQAVITLFEPESKCALDTTSIRSLKSIYEKLPDHGVSDDTFSKIHRFIRLWRKSGWTIHEVDAFTQVMGEQDISKELISKLSWVMKIVETLKIPVLQITALWGNIDSYGDKSLYNKLFLNKAIQKIDAVFQPDSFGRILQDNAILIKDHLPAVSAALKLSNDTLMSIVADAQIDLALAPLNIQNLSIIYRYTLLAKALKLQPMDLIILKNIFETKPFSKWNEALKKFEEINPDKTYEFIETVQKVKAAGFKPSVLNYIIKDIIDPTTSFIIKDEKILNAVIAIRAGLLKIEQDYPTEQNVTLTEEILRNTLSVVFKTDLAEQLISTLNGNILYSTSTDKNLGVVIPDILKEKISYLKAKGILQSKGVLKDNERTTLEGLAGATNAFKEAIKRIYEKPEQLIREDFGIVFAFKEINPGVAENKIKDAIKLLLNHPAQAAEMTLTQKQEMVYKSLLPYLKEQLKKTLITQTIASVLGLDEPTAQVLLQPQYESIIQWISSNGLSGKYYKDIAFTQLGLERVDSEINFNWDINSPDAAIPADQFSIRWEGFISPETSAEYTLMAEVAEADDAVKVFLEDQVLFEKPAGNPMLSWEGAATLTAGKIYKIKVEYKEDVQKAGLQFYWKTDSQSKEIIPASFCYPAVQVENFIQLLKKIHRATLFINGFKLTADEINHLIKYKANFDNIDFTQLTYFNWKRLNEYTNTLRKNIPQGLSTLVNLFEEANKTNPAPSKNDFLDKVVNVTGWTKEQLTTLCDVPYFNLNVADFKNEINLLKLQKAVQLSRKTGVPVQMLFSWAKPETNFDQLELMAESVKKTVKAKYEEEDWLEAAKGLSDKIRVNQQQALISYLLVQPALIQWGVKDADGLFEYFLIDVQMDACMDTSRIKQAISSVQLFVARVLLNLESQTIIGGKEAGVSPSAIDRNRWDWMKNYRIWEANRKIFLYPENWLEPELRDDKSPFFKELESELMQNDITNISVENAYRTYLGKLNEVSNLEMVGMYQDDSTKLLHMFGRTHGAPYQYYYRTYNIQYNSWKAWEKVQVDIRSVDDKDNKGVHLLPLIWKNRLFLFWPEFREKHDENSSNNNTSVSELSKKSPNVLKQTPYWSARLGFTEYRDGKWQPKQLSKTEFIPGFTLDGQFAKFTGDLSTININGVINSSNELEIHFFLNGYGTFGKIQFSDIQAEMLNINPSYSPELLNTSYETYFLSYQKTGKFNFKSVDYLAKNQSHKILYSHQYKDFDLTLQYPFFYFDSNRSYFAVPEDFGYYIDVVKNPDKVGYIPLDKIKDKYYIEIEPLKPKPIGPDDYMPGIDGEIVINNTTKFNVNVFDTINAKTTTRAAMRSSVMNVMSNTFGLEEEIETAVEEVPVFHTLSAHKTAPPSALEFKTKNQYMVKADTVDKAFGGVYTISPYIKWYEHYKGLKFYTFYHPYSSNFISLLNQGGTASLLEADTSLANDNGTFFNGFYQPNTTRNYVNTSYPKVNVDFGEMKDGMFEMGPYSIYNWEVFFHAPLFIATHLSKNGRYEEAMNWFHYIFDPTTNEKPSSTNPNARYWKVLPFKTMPADTIEDFLKGLQPNMDPTKENKKIGEWRDNPFKPHLIARGRPLAYMKNVVVKYLENLIAWGDDLFMRDTIESINEATQLYIIAAHILGPRPQFVPKRGEIKAETYDSLKNKLDDFSNALVQMENLFPFSSEIPASTTTFNGSLLGIGKALYFSIPSNEKLLQYWDTVGDRLFKIRHCMNIEGVERKLALFEPPIEPGLLVKAAAQGLSIGSLLNDLNAPTPAYRFSSLIQRANEFCNDVKTLGNAFLGAIEKRDTEEINRLRSQHEENVLTLTTEVKLRQVLEAKANKESLQKNRETVKKKLQHYVDLLGITDYSIPDEPTIGLDLTIDSQLPADSIFEEINPEVDVALVDSDEAGVKFISKEKHEIDKNTDGVWWQGGATAGESLAGLLHLIPDFGLYGTPLGVGGQTRFGGGQLGSATSALAKVPQIFSSTSTFEANQAAKMGTYIRREQEWSFQANQAAKEIIQVDKQITAAEIRVQLAQKEYDAHLKQVANVQEISLFLKGESIAGYIKKFSTTELYQWMKDQLFFIYKQSYMLAYDMAKKAEKAYQFELGLPDASFIQYGYWDSTYEGLIAGDKLQLALRQMEKSFLEQNIREYELTKHVSLALINPRALLDLKNTGSCEINLPEELFDLDYPGHYFRRIKSISISIPCVVGPYTTVNSTLRLLKNEIRVNTNLNTEGKYERNNEDGIVIDDDRFVEGKPPVKRVATSAAQSDSGLFELSFKDERYLPFEGAGVISTWKLELNGKYKLDGQLKDFSQFDYNSIADIIFHINYTSREDAGLFKNEAVKHLDDFLKKAAENAPEPFMRMFSLKYEFPDTYYKLIEVGGNPQKAEVTLSSKFFPVLLENKKLKVLKAEVFLMPKDGKTITDPGNLKFSNLDATVDGAPAGAWQKLPFTEMKKVSLNITDFDPQQKWTLDAGNNQLKKDEIDDVLILFRYSMDA